MAKHVHQYQRILIGDKFAMRCIKPFCNHYTFGNSKLSFPLLLAKIAECSRCSSPFILSRRALRMANPCCDSCVRRKDNPILTSAERFFRDLEKELV